MAASDCIKTEDASSNPQFFCQQLIRTKLKSTTKTH